MRKILVLALVIAASPALADGPGAVTADKTQGAANPACHQFQTNGGQTWYGVSVNSLTYAGTLAQMVRSNSGLCAISFSVINTIPDCANGVVSVGSVVCQ